MQMTMFWKSWNLTFWSHPQGRGWGVGVRVNICYHVAAVVIPFNSICNPTMFWKSLILTPGWERGERVCWQSSCYHVAAFVFPFIWCATWPCSEKVKFLPQGSGAWGSMGKIFVWVGFCGQNVCYHVALFVIPFNDMPYMTMFWKSWIL